MRHLHEGTCPSWPGVASGTRRPDRDEYRFPRNLGGPGADLLRGGTEDDDLFGQDGDDTLIGHAGDDTLTGGPDTNTLRGSGHVLGDTCANGPTIITCEFVPV